MKKVTAALCVLITSFTDVTIASTDISNFKVNGFLSQGFIYTNDNNFFGDSNNGSWQFREIGLNSSWQPKPSWLFAGQLLSRKAGAGIDSSPKVDYALIDFSPIAESWGEAGLSLGRIKNPLGLYNDTRDVAFTRPGIFVPHSVYLEKFRDLFLSSDGLQLHADWAAGDHAVQFQLNVGDSRIDESFIEAVQSDNLLPPGSLDRDGKTYMGRVLYDWQGKLLLGLSAGHSPFVYDSDLLALFGIDNVRFKADYWMLSAQYNSEDWRLTGEYIRESIRIKGLESFTPIARISPMGYYLQVDRRFGSETEAFLRYEYSVDNKAARLQDQHRSYTRGVTVGARWDFASNWMLRGEYSRYKGYMIVPNQDDPGRDRSDGRWDMFSLLLSYRF